MNLLPSASRTVKGKISGSVTEMGDAQADALSASSEEPAPISKESKDSLVSTVQAAFHRLDITGSEIDGLSITAFLLQAHLSSQQPRERMQTQG